MDPVGALKWLFIRTINGIPAAVKSEFSGSSKIPIILNACELVVATVFKSAVAEDIPVVVDPLLPVAICIFAKTEVLTSASVFWPDTTLDVAIVNSWFGSSYKKAFTGCW